ncbi:MAG: polysaccharide deacetylase family protein [Candidatus Dormibacteria bacterium]
MALALVSLVVTLQASEPPVPLSGRTGAVAPAVRAAAATVDLTQDEGGPELPVPLKDAAPAHALGLIASTARGYTSAVVRVVSDLPGSTPGQPVVALTFDDGPDPRVTPAVLAVLAGRGVPATFFMAGRMAAAHPELVREVAAAGHGVGGHTWNHIDLRTLPDAGYEPEVDRTDQLLAGLSGQDIRCVRPPRGATTMRVAALLAGRGLSTMLWSVDPTDWSRPGAGEIVRRTLSAVRPGSIILLHDAGGDRSQTVAALPAILDGLRDRGLTPVTLCH